MRISGYVVLWNSLSLDLGGFREQFARGAFTESLRQRDQILLNGHDSVRILARKSTGGLTLKEDSTGLHFEASLPDTTEGRDVHRLVSDRILQNMSFGFSIPDHRGEEWTLAKDGSLLRTVRQASLIEVSPVAMPAYPSSTVKSTGEAIRASMSAPVPRKAKAGPIGQARAQAIRERMRTRQHEAVVCGF